MIANARMYSVCAAAAQAWKELLRWVLHRSALDWPVIDHDPATPIAALWNRPDLGAAMMCGLPYSQRKPRPKLVAAPIPSPARYGGKPVYFSDLVVRADSSIDTLEDSFGGVVGYTLPDSQSGCVALRRYLLPYRDPQMPSLYRSVVGNLVAGRRVVEAVVSGEIDIGPLDSYVHDLLRHLEPDFVKPLRVVATTDAAPIPPFVATGPVEADSLVRLQQAFLDVADAPELADLRGTLLLRGFALPVDRDYAVFDAILRDAQRYAGVW